MSHFILLYYCYTPIENPEKFREEHHLLCLSLGLLGRIIVAEEGLNGTVSGTKEACEQYMKSVHADPCFAHTEFKTEPYEGHAFAKLHVRCKPEIVHADLLHLKPYEKTAAYIEPSAFREVLKQPSDDVVILDCRSNYEHQVGRFKNALTLDMENFRDFPEKVKELEYLKNKTVITYCTGGIKCEKASAYLLEQGFENVYQLHGGIIKYGIEAGGEDFEGKCYVFDNRVIADVNKVNPVVLSHCHICGTECDRMINCANPECNEHLPVCEKCGWEMDGACSEACKHHPLKRTYNGTGYYQKNTVGYNPYIGLRRRQTQED